MEYWIIFFLLCIFLLIVLEYLYHDCINGVNSKKGWNRVTPPDENDSILAQLEKIRKMVRHNYNYVIWRQALIVALISGFIAGYCLLQRLPTLFEYLALVFVIFLVCYFVSSWFSTHYLYPNNFQIERSLQILSDSISQQN